MARSMTAALLAELDAKSIAPIFFVEADFNSGFLRFWSGIGPITAGFDGAPAVSWTGSGDLLSMSPVVETAGATSNGLNVSLSGIPSALIAAALGDFVLSQGRSFTAYFGTMNGAVPVVDPFVVFGGRMDTMVINKGADSSDITITSESKAISQRRANVRLLTDAAQRALYPDDRGMEFVPGLQQHDIKWAQP